MVMKIYLKDGNTYWLDEPLEGADAEREVSPIQEEILRNGGTADYRGGQLIVTPKAPETAEIATGNIITKRAFLARFTPEEFAAIKTAVEQQPMVDYFWQLFMVSEEIDLSFPETTVGVNALEQMGLLAAGRAAEVLG